FSRRCPSWRRRVTSPGSHTATSEAIGRIRRVASGIDRDREAIVLPSPPKQRRLRTDATGGRQNGLEAIWIPDEATEAIRDLVRARDDARLAQRRIRQQLLKFLLRHDRQFTEGKEHWTK